MATKFGYIERNIENDVNWSDISSGFADMLEAEREGRAKSKEALDDAMYDAQAGLKKNMPLGYDTDSNDRVINLMTSGTSFLSAANKDLKSGTITPNEYMRKVQKINGNVDNIYNLQNNYNKLYEGHLKRYDDGDSGELERVAFESVDAMKDYGFFIDNDGVILSAPSVKGKDGVNTIDTKNARSSEAMFNIAQQNINKLDVLTATENATKKLAAHITGASSAASRSGSGKTTTTADIRLRPAYTELKNALIDGIITSDLDSASVLADYIKGYEVVTEESQLPTDPAEREKFILLDTKSNSKEARVILTDKQKVAAREEIDVLLEGMIDSKYTETTTSREYTPIANQEYWKSVADASKVKKDLSTYWNRLGWGTAEEKGRAVETLISNEHVIKRGILGIVPATDGKSLQIIYEGGKKSRTIDLTKNYTPEEWALVGSEITGESDSKKAVSAGGGWPKGKKYSYLDDNGRASFSNARAVREGAKPVQDDQVAFNGFIDAEFEKMGNKTQKILDFAESLGYDVKMRSGKIVITSGESEQEFSNTTGGLAGLKRIIKSNPDNATEYKRANKSQKGILD